MVIFSETAQNDLEDILYGLVTWKKHNIEFDHAVQYTYEIREVCESLDKKTFQIKLFSIALLRALPRRLFCMRF